MRRNKGLKALVYSLVGTMVISNVAPAYAYTDSTGAVNDTQEVTQTQDAECEVYAELGSEFKVIIPKKITLDGATKTGAYTVSVEGDIAGTEYIKVVPDASFTLTSTKLADVTATITQDKTEWLCGEIVGSGVIGNGAIDAQGITAGAWNGHFYFNVSLEETTSSGDESGTEDENQLMLTLSEDEVLMGSTDTVQVNAYIEGENVNDYVSWESDNENIVVTEGLVETSASAQVGDTATVTVTATSNASLFATDSEPLTATAQFTVTVIDMAYTAEGEDEVITSVDLEAGETKNIEVTIIPASVSGTVSWTTTAPAGVNLVKNGNTVTVKIADDMAVGNTYDLVASYGNFSKLLTINIVAEEAHVHSYDAGVVTTEATCTTAGVRTYTCNCGDSYTEEISALGHKIVDSKCERCGIESIAGLYDADGVMLCSWEDSGIDVETNYTSSNATTIPYYKTTTTSPYYVLTNKYPTATTVILPDSVTSIGNFAFYQCTNKMSVIVPSSVKTIGQSAFFGCTGLTDITLSEGVTSIGSGTFRGCTSLANITIPSSITTVGDYAFYECTGLSNITILEGVTTIEKYAFAGCTNTTKVIIPSSVTSLGERAFCNCAGELIINCSIASDNGSGTSPFWSTYCTKITIGGSGTIGKYTFSKNTKLTDVIIKDGITTIGQYAFENCTVLKNATIPNSVTKINTYAFNYCKALTTVNYTGTEEQWNAITIGGSNTYLNNATKVYNYVAE